MTPHRAWSRRFSLALAVLVALSAALLSGAGVFGPVEDALTSKRAELLSRPPTGDLAIVEVDARSLAQLRTPGRGRAATMRGSCASDQGRGIADRARHRLQRPLRRRRRSAHSSDPRRPHVILPTFEQKASDRAADRQVIANRPDAAFRDAWVGGVNIFPGADGMVRDYPAATFIDGQVQPSIAALVAEKSGLGDRRFEPDWAINARRIPRYSFVDVMEGRVDPARLRGKRVLIGATAIELGDRYPVPRYGVVPGVVIQALAAKSLLQNRPVQPSGWAVTFAGILLIALLLVARPLSRPLRYAIVLGAVVAAALGLPLVVQRLWPVALTSAAWLYTASPAPPSRRPSRRAGDFACARGRCRQRPAEPVGPGKGLDARQGIR